LHHPGVPEGGTPLPADPPETSNFEKERGRRVSLPIADHLTLLRLFLESVVRELNAKTTVLVGMSSGADIAMRMIAEGRVDRNHVDGILAPFLKGGDFPLAEWYRKSKNPTKEPDRSSREARRST
jgi:alpha-beta hydrolase superfamily lysophospholipase